MDMTFILSKELFAIILMIFINLKLSDAIDFNITILDPLGYNIGTSLEPNTTSELVLDTSHKNKPLAIKGIYVKCNRKSSYKDEICDITYNYCDLAMETCESCDILCNSARMVGPEGVRVRQSCEKKCPLYLMIRENVPTEHPEKSITGCLINGGSKNLQEPWMIIAVAIALTALATTILLLISAFILWKCPAIRHVNLPCSKKAKNNFIERNVENDDIPDKDGLFAHVSEPANEKQTQTDDVRKDVDDVRQKRQDIRTPCNDEQEQTTVKDIDMKDNIVMVESQPLLGNPSSALQTNTSCVGYNVAPHDPRPGYPKIGTNAETQTGTDKADIGLSETPLSPGYSANTNGVMKDPDQLIHHADDSNPHDSAYISDMKALRRGPEFTDGSR